MHDRKPISHNQDDRNEALLAALKEKDTIT